MALRNRRGPSVSELAERIKAIKAGNNIEAAPQRARQNHSSAEEPITARIRRRTATLPASTTPIESNDTSWAGVALRRHQFSIHPSSRS